MSKGYACVTIDVDTLMADMSLPRTALMQESQIRHLSYLKVIPRLLILFEQLKIKATFFIVGRDGLIPENKTIIRQIVRSGHEIANHSLLHERELSHFSEEEFIKDVSESEKILSDISGRKISGFRMPGSTINAASLNLLEKMGYLYDSSLNSSLPYNLAKFCYKKMFNKNRFRIPHQDIYSLCAPHEPYLPDKGNIYKKRNNNGGSLRYPLRLYRLSICLL